jgi:uncharacterized protein
VSLVGFRFVHTRVLGVPALFHLDFPEVNLRFYVVREVGSERRRGVVFLCELVSRRIVALIARAAYNEPYRVVPLRARVHHSRTGDAERIEYSWRDAGGWCRLAGLTQGPLRACAPDSDEEFFTSRHWGYTRQRDGGTIEYHVEHPSWRASTVTESVVEGRLADTYGEVLAARLKGAPASVIVADGSEVSVSHPVRIVLR